MATGGKKDCQWTDSSTFKVLKGRKVILFPDLGCYGHWHKKATTLNQGGFKVVVSDLLESYASKADQQEGFDLADYFIQRDAGFG